MMNIDEENITDVEDENAIDGDSEGNDGDGRDDDVTEGNEESDVVHGEIISPGGTAISTGSADLDRFYADFEHDTADKLHNAAVEAKRSMLASGNAALDAGRTINAVKAMLDYGTFGQWLKLEFTSSERTARNFMSFAETIDQAERLRGPDGKERLLELPQTVVYEVGSRNIPDSAREDIIVRWVDGSLSSPQEVRREVKEAAALEAERRSEEEQELEEKRAPRNTSKSTKAANVAKARGQDEEEAALLALPYAERKRLHKAGERKFNIWLIATAIAKGESEPQDIVSRYGEIATGPKGKLTPEDHQEVSETLLAVMKAFLEDPADGIESLRPRVPPLPVKGTKSAKAKTTESAEPADDAADGED